MRGFTKRSGALAVASGLTISLLAGGVAMTASPAQAATVTTSTSSSKVLLKYGSKGQQVWRLEKKLRVKPADKYYKSATVKKVKKVQKWAKLPQTGSVNKRTMRAINRWDAKKDKWEAQARARAAKNGSTKRAKIITAAKKYDGGRYVRGGNSPRGFDCSGYVKYVVKKATGKSLVRTAAGQRKQIKKIGRSSARPGDLVFFSSGGHVYHVGIYAGGKKLYHASKPGTRTGIGPIFSSSVSYGRVA